MTGFDLYRFRHRYIMSQKQMAALLKISRGHYSKVENCQVAMSDAVKARFEDLKDIATDGHTYHRPDGKPYFGVVAYMAFSIALGERKLVKKQSLLEYLRRILWKKHSK